MVSLAPQASNDLLLQRAGECLRSGALDQAIAIYRALLRRDPDDVSALHQLSLIHRYRGCFESALGPLARAAALRPDLAELWMDLAAVHQALGRLAEAVGHYRAVLALQPDHPRALFLLGNALQRLDRPAEAVTCYQQLLERAPDHAEAHRDLGHALLQLGHVVAAATHYRRALVLLPSDVPGWSGLGCCLEEEGRPDQAVTAHARAGRLVPRDPELVYNLATALQSANRLDEAIAGFGACLALQPDHADAAWNQAFCRLAAGDSDWRLFERRWKTPSQGLVGRRFDRPLWLGETPLAGQTILLHAEQGLGDSLQCLRFVPALVERGARVLIEIQPALVPLLADWPGPAGIISQGDPLPAFDCHCPLFSLPLALRADLDRLPASPYLAAPAAAAVRWSVGWIPGRRKRVGLVWAGNPENGNDRNRSMPLPAILPLLDAPCDFVVLQKPLSEDEAAVLRSCRNVTVLSHRLGSFADTAAVIERLDLVVSVDTAVAHLAGAMGKPVWILLCFAPDWRWLRDRADSPWYPTARLFRQGAPGDWAGLVSDVTRELAGWDGTPAEAV